MEKTISIIKEKRDGEYRVILTPREVKLFISNGFRVLIEHGAGENVGIPDALFEEAGAQLVDTATAWNASKLVAWVRSVCKLVFIGHEEAPRRHPQLR